MSRTYRTKTTKIFFFLTNVLSGGGVLDLVQHGNGKRIARSCSSVLSRSRLISFLLVLLVCVPPAILLLLLVVAHVRALLLLLLLLLRT